MRGLVLLLLLVPLAVAEHTPRGRCTAEGAPNLNYVWLNQGDGDPDNDVYIEDRSVLANGVWVYLETNGIYAPTDFGHALQRGGSSQYVATSTEVCVDHPDPIRPDELIF